MKNRRKLFEVMQCIALAAVIGFGVAACESPTDPDSKKPTDSDSKSLTGITVTTPPSKAQYNLNEDFDPAGMVVSAAYSDGSTAVVTDYTLSGYDKTVAGNQTITVTYNGKIAVFSVWVIDPSLEPSVSLTGITVTTPPGKVQYNLNENFDPAGMVVTAAYSDGSTEVVTDYTLSGYDKTVAGNQTITVTYKEKTDKFVVEVIDPDLPTAEVPTANPPAGTYASAQTVTLATSTPEAAIYYTLDGSTPDTASSLFNSSILISHSSLLKAIAVKGGMNDSAVLEAAYTIQTVNSGNQTPVAGDFDISGATTYTYDGTPKSVTITPKQGKSSGNITIYYNESTTAPSAVGTYTVTFDVAAATGYTAATGLAAGTLTINPATPVASDFVIGNLNQTMVNITAVTITPKTGKSTGAITIYYNGSTTLPTAIGTYTVTFDVAAATGFNAAVGLAAGTLTINNVTIGVQFSDFGDETIDLTKSAENDIHIDEGERLTVTVDGDFDTYQWYLNGQSTYGGNTYTFYTSNNTSIGIHTVTAVVTKNGVPYSKEVTFRVVR